MDPRRIAILGFEGAQSLNITGPLEVFETAERLSPGRYRTAVVSPDGEPFATGSGLRIAPECSLAELAGPIDTLLVVGGLGAAAEPPPLAPKLAAAAGRSRRVASVCTGAFLLADAGLLDGRRAATHWSAVYRLAADRPAIDVDHDAIFVRDGDVWSSAGVTAGIDLALALVEEDHGRAAALEIARWLVVFANRQGGQAQFSVPLAVPLVERAPIRAVQELVRAYPESDLTVAVLAAHAQMSVSVFARAFRHEVGMTPATYVEAVRVERAAAMIQTTSESFEWIAAISGLGRPETMRRAFRRRLGVSPSKYRDRFRAVPDGAS